MITEIMNVMGGQTEKVPLKVPVVCADYIEKWLNNLEKVMQETIKDIIRVATMEIYNQSTKDGSF